MALVQKLDIVKERQGRRHNAVRGECFVLVEDCKKYLQINTFGSNEREHRGNTSQTIQFSEESLEQLEQIIRDHFKG